MSIDLRTFERTRGANASDFRGVSRAEFAEALLPWLVHKASSPSQVENWEQLLYTGMAAANAGYEGIDALVIEWAEREAAPSALSVAACFIEGYWEHAAIIHPPAIEVFVRAGERFPEGSEALCLSIMPLYKLLRKKASLPSLKREEIRRVVLRQLRGMDKPGTITIEHARWLIKDIESLGI